MLHFQKFNWEVEALFLMEEIKLDSINDNIFLGLKRMEIVVQLLSQVLDFTFQVFLDARVDPGAKIKVFSLVEEVGHWLAVN